MSIELVPSVQCNLSCPYCYQNPMRDAGNFGDSSLTYDMEAMKAGLTKEGGNFTLFGGEALLMPIEDMEELFAFGLEKFGSNGVQSNGSLITAAHIELFKKYKVGVGISADGPGDMNNSRWAGSLEKTRAATVKTMDNIEALVEAGRTPSIIITLHRGNALPENREALKEWFQWMDDLGIYSARLHILEIDHESVASEMALTQKENIEVFLDLANFETGLKQLRFEIFKDIRSLLTGDDSRTVCVWNACDPKTTAAVRGVDGQGHGSNCGRTNKDGVAMLKTDEKNYERQVALYHTPQEHNGCQGCRFFVMCKGECPGTAVDGDWRNRTRDCEAWMAMFTHHEKLLMDQGVLPLSLNGGKREQVEAVMLEAWTNGQNIQIHSALSILDGSSPRPTHRFERTDHGDAHGDSNVTPPWTHTDGPVAYAGYAEYQGFETGEHGDEPHGDDHGDSSGAPHLDHEDLNAPVVIIHGDEAHGDHGDGGAQPISPHIDTEKEIDPAHGDEAHGDGHADDSAYQDGHVDVPHGDDTAHEDSGAVLRDLGAQPVPHGDEPHQDASVHEDIN